VTTVLSFFSFQHYSASLRQRLVSYFLSLAPSRVTALFFSLRGFFCHAPRLCSLSFSTASREGQRGSFGFSAVTVPLKRRFSFPRSPASNRNISHGSIFRFLFSPRSFFIRERPFRFGLGTTSPPSFFPRILRLRLLSPDGVGQPRKPIFCPEIKAVELGFSQNTIAREPCSFVPYRPRFELRHDLIV